VLAVLVCKSHRVPVSAVDARHIGVSVTHGGGCWGRPMA
jgi:hypothetical protein